MSARCGPHHLLLLFGYSPFWNSENDARNCPFYSMPEITLFETTPLWKVQCSKNVRSSGFEMWYCGNRRICLKKQTYNREKKKKKTWVFGLAQRDTRKTAFFVVANRKKWNVAAIDYRQRQHRYRDLSWWLGRVSQFGIFGI